MKSVRYLYSNEEMFILGDLLGSDFGFTLPTWGDLSKQLFELVTTQ